MASQWLSYRGNPGRDNIKSDDSFLNVNITGYSEIDTSFVIERVRVDYYIMYPTEGSFAARINGTLQTVNTGDILLIHADDLQYYEKQNKEHFAYYWVHFTGHAAKSILSSCGFSKSGVYPVGISDKIIRMFKTLFADFYGKKIEGTYLEVYTAAHLMEILAAMKECMENKKQKSSNTEQKIYASVRYINAHYTEALSVEKLAEDQEMCAGYYSKMFIKHIGTSPRDYFVRLRLQNAAILLTQSDMSITEIAASVGYNDPLYFSRIFKKNFSLSPAAYRQLNNITAKEIL